MILGIRNIERGKAANIHVQEHVKNSALLRMGGYGKYKDILEDVRSREYEAFSFQA